MAEDGLKVADAAVPTSLVDAYEQGRFLAAHMRDAFGLRARTLKAG